MDKEDNKDIIVNKPLKEILRDNQKAIIAKKESYYDKAIEKLKLKTWMIDVFIILMIALAIIVVVTQAK